MCVCWGAGRGGRGGSGEQETQKGGESWKVGRTAVSAFATESIVCLVPRGFGALPPMHSGRDAA